MSGLQLGPFVLDKPIARGGTGVVWRATHADQGVRVAIKVLDRGEQAAMQREVQAVAALNHPGIVLLYDHGTTPSHPLGASRHPIPANAPWLAMELASQGSLKESKRQMRWGEVRNLLTAILDALAHAHARGVIHRDIKPGNVLISGPTDPRPGMKLADFGLAVAADEELHSDRIIGTPAYMSPEQLRGQWRRYGPHTDLYAVGLLAWELVCGKQAVQGEGPKAIAQAHLTGQFQPFSPRIPVPPSLEAWIRTLSHRDHRRRFSSAADAAWGLWGLEEVDDAPATHLHGIGPIPTNPTMTLDDTLMLQHGLIELYDDITESDGFAGQSETLARAERPALPLDWRREHLGPPPIQLVGVGLNLFGLRSVPMVGRLEERDAIWRKLHRVTEDRQSHLMLLRGAAGNGKSRLVEWISQRACEVGGAHILRAIHGPTGGPMDGLRPMLMRHFRANGLGAEDLGAHLISCLPDADQGIRDDLQRYLIGDLQPTEGQASSDERWSVVRAVLAHLAEERPVIVWLDDIQWGMDSLAFGQWMLKHGRELPVLLLCTAQAEALAESPEVDASTQRLMQSPQTTEVRVGPLKPRSQTQLVEALLGLEGGLARELASRAGGNPLFTVQLVGDWVARGVLVPGNSGFRLRPGERAVLPDSLHEVWGARLDRLLEDQPAHARQVLELAATLGQEVHQSEWEQACTFAGIGIPKGLVHGLVAGRLALPTEEGLAFSHGMLRESLVRQATEHNRWPQLNRWCADALDELDADLNAGRVGLHLHHAGQYADAVGPLRRGARQLAATGQTTEALAHLDIASDGLRRSGTPSSDPTWGQVWLHMAQVCSTANDDDRANRLSRKSLSSARRHGWKDLTVRALLELARVERVRGNIPAARRFASQALDAHSGEPAHQKSLGETHICLAHLDILSADLTSAQAHLAKARPPLEATNAQSQITSLIRYEGDLARMEMRFEDARSLFEEAYQRAMRAGNRSQAHSNLHGVAEMNRLIGNLEQAERGYRQVARYQTGLGRDASITQLNLGQCAVARESYDEARSVLEKVREVWESRRRPGYTAVAHMALLPAVAGLGDWHAFEHHLHAFSRLAETAGMTDIDTAINAELAGDIAARSDHIDRAHRTWTIALQTWAAMNADGPAQRVQSKLQGLGGPT